MLGTDLSPTQPAWVPPNVRFEIDDATKPWTWADGSFDLVHMRYLFGSIADWPELFRQAHRVCAPGGWVESGECEVDFISDDGTVAPKSALATWGPMCKQAGEKIGRPFTIITDDLQRKGMEAAGFVDIHEVNYKVPNQPPPRVQLSSELTWRSEAARRRVAARPQARRDWAIRTVDIGE